MPGIHVRPMHKAIKARLAGDATLAGLATGGVHRSDGAAGSAYPYAVFSLQDAPERPTFDEPGGTPGKGTFVRFVYAIKGVDRSLSAARAAAIYVRVHDLLIGDVAEAAMNASLAGDGLVLLGVQREGLLGYDEVDNESKIQHVGGVYVFVVQEI